MEKNIVIIDDDPHMIQLFTMYLKQGAYTLKTFTAPRSALRFLKEQKVDLVITDLQMPGMNGWELIKQIREQSSALPIIVTSAFGSKEMVHQALEHGATANLDKPFTQEQLLNLVKKLLDKRS